MDIKSKLDLHKNFWNNKGSAIPIVSFRVGDYFFARNYEAGRKLINKGGLITSEDIDVDAFLADYERMFQETEEINQTGIFTAEPYSAIPWAEAIVGCPVLPTPSAFITKKIASSIDDVLDIEFDDENPWVKKLAEFSQKLTNLSAGRFPVGQPILRGPSDILGAMMGQSEMIFAMVEEPEKTRKALIKISDIFIKISQTICENTSFFRGGHSIGFYHLWAPDKCIWYQEDLTALLSPSLYKEFLYNCGERITKDFHYNLHHLHPSSFYLLEQLINMPTLKAIQINKDVGGPSIEEMMPRFREVLKKKPLVVWGELTVEDIMVMKELFAEPIMLSITAKNVDEAKSKMSLIKKEVDIIE